MEQVKNIDSAASSLHPQRRNNVTVTVTTASSVTSTGRTRIDFPAGTSTSNGESRSHHKAHSYPNDPPSSTQRDPQTLVGKRSRRGSASHFTGSEEYRPGTFVVPVRSKSKTAATTARRASTKSTTRPLIWYPSPPPPLPLPPLPPHAKDNHPRLEEEKTADPIETSEKPPPIPRRSSKRIKNRPPPLKLNRSKMAMAMTPVEWQHTMDTIRELYMRREYKECRSKCVEILRTFRQEIHPVYSIYFAFYAATSLELMAQPLHTSSSNKLPLLEESRSYFQQAEAKILAAKTIIPSKKTRTKSKGSINFSIPLSLQHGNAENIERPFSTSSVHSFNTASSRGSNSSAASAESIFTASRSGCNSTTVSGNMDGYGYPSPASSVCSESGSDRTIKPSTSTPNLKGSMASSQPQKRVTFMTHAMPAPTPLSPPATPECEPAAVAPCAAPTADSIQQLHRQSLYLPLPRSNPAENHTLKYHTHLSSLLASVQYHLGVVSRLICDTVQARAKLRGRRGNLPDLFETVSATLRAESIVEEESDIDPYDDSEEALRERSFERERDARRRNEIFKDLELDRIPQTPKRPLDSPLTIDASTRERWMPTTAPATPVCDKSPPPQLYVYGESFLNLDDDDDDYVYGSVKRKGNKGGLRPWRSSSRPGSRKDDRSDKDAGGGRLSEKMRNRISMLRERAWVRDRFDPTKYRQLADKAMDELTFGLTYVI